MLGRQSPFEVREVVMLRGEREKLKVSVCIAEGGDGVRWLPCLSRHHGNMFMSTSAKLIKLSIRHAGRGWRGSKTTSVHKR